MKEWFIYQDNQIVWEISIVMINSRVSILIYIIIRILRDT